MEKPELTHKEHLLYAKNGKLPESFRKRREEYQCWLKAQAKLDEAKPDKGGKSSKSEAYVKASEEKAEKPAETTEVKDESADNDFENLPPDTKFPYNYGGSHYFLSNGEKVQGKQVALKAQAKLDEAK